MTSYVGLKALDMGYDAHLTLAYYGRMGKDREEKITALTEFMAKEFDFPAITFAWRDSIDIFANNTPVIKVIPEAAIIEFQRALVNEIPSVSEFGWNPHVTLKLDIPDPIIIPKMIRFNSLGVY